MQNKIVLVWVGGTGMSGIAWILHDLGFSAIVWIDSNESQLTEKLRNEWIEILIGHGQIKIEPGDAVIYSAAADQSPEVIEAKEIASKYRKPMLVMNYFSFLGEISKYFVTRGISGTNGKSSTTAMAVTAANKHLPSFGLGLLGALVPDLGNKSYAINEKYKTAIYQIFEYILTGKWRINPEYIKKYCFIVEACEYRRHFLSLDTWLASISSLELDHTDFFADWADYRHAFVDFVDRNSWPVLAQWEETTKKLAVNDKKTETIDTTINIDFAHIIDNHAQANAATVLTWLGKIAWYMNEKIDLKEAQETLVQFGGLWRRMEYLGKNDAWTTFFSDYAHMPSSIESIAQSFHDHFDDKQIHLVFQPHQVKRVLEYREAFVASIQEFDSVSIWPLYAAREQWEKYNHEFINPSTTLDELGERFATACEWNYMNNFAEMENMIRWLWKNDIVVLATAGDLDYIIRREIVLDK